MTLRGLLIPFRLLLVVPLYLLAAVFAGSVLMVRVLAYAVVVTYRDTVEFYRGSK